VQKLIGNWELEDPNPGAYGSVLAGMSKAAPIFMTSEEVTNPAEPERILKMSLEIGVLGDTGIEAIEQLIVRGKTGVILDLLDQSPPNTEIANAVWQNLLAHRPLRATFEMDKPDLRLVERITNRAQLGAASPLLDAIEAADDRPWVPKVIELLASLGPEVAPLAIERLPLVRWSTQRQLFILLGKIGTLPEDFPAEDYLRHPDARVRREVFRVLLSQQAWRQRAVTLALVDADESIVRLGLTAVQEGCCPPEVIPILVNRLSDETADPQLRALTIKVFGTSRTPEALQAALGFALAPKKLFRRTRLAPKSPEMLAAISVLGTQWPDDPRAREVTKLARGSRDPDIRSMATTTGKSK
jgi:hypothetical protein